MGFSAGSVSAVGFIVKIGAINQNVDPAVALCPSQPIAVSGCIVLPALRLRWMVLGCLRGHAIETQTTTFLPAHSPSTIS